MSRIQNVLPEFTLDTLRGPMRIKTKLTTIQEKGNTMNKDQATKIEAAVDATIDAATAAQAAQTQAPAKMGGLSVMSTVGIVLAGAAIGVGAFFAGKHSGRKAAMKQLQAPTETPAAM